ncbi:MAG: sensor domain-containing diguanylate cyclase [Candidatus Omnitrophica bacterium]|nr:sensor domain-containing diguanylate cyclase [Candidatus Omnitrophota bacterium]
MVVLSLHMLVITGAVTALLIIIQELRVIVLKKRLTQAVVDIEKRNIQFSYLIKTAQTLTTALSKQKLLRIIIETIGDITKSDAEASLCALYLIDYNLNKFIYATGYNLDVTMLSRPTFRIDDHPFKELKKNKDIIFFDEREDVKNLFLKGGKARLYQKVDCGILIPLIVENEIMGVVASFLAKSSYDFLKKEAFILKGVSNQSSIALGSAVQSELAVLDRLTKVYNHAYFEGRLEQEVARADRYKYPVSVLMIDIDHFKVINDTYGHQQGDFILKKVANIIKSNIRAVDLCARYGGEEFAVILPETDLTVYSDRNGTEENEPDSGGALAKAKLLRDMIEKMELKTQEGHVVNLTVSIGIGVKRFPESANMTKDQLIKEADQYLYKAKQEGRNRVCHP